MQARRRRGAEGSQRILLRVRTGVGSLGPNQTELELSLLTQPRRLGSNPCIVGAGSARRSSGPEDQRIPKSWHPPPEIVP